MTIHDEFVVMVFNEDLFVVGVVDGGKVSIFYQTNTTNENFRRMESTRVKDCLLRGL